ASSAANSCARGRDPRGNRLDPGPAGTLTAPIRHLRPHEPNFFRHPADRQSASRQLSRRDPQLRRAAARLRLHLLHRRFERAYPVLMAADILLYKATHVPVGEDQKQHVELARDIAGAFNRRYERDFFPLPEPQIFGEATRVMSLRDGTKKMSKSDTSDYSRINMTDDAETVALKIRRAKTDPEPLPHTIEALEKRPEADNLVSIYAALADLTREAALARFAGENFSTFKEALSG